MNRKQVFTHTEPALSSILEELRRREPIFHTREFGVSTADYERSMVSDYWEVGASGRRYSRDFILHELDRRASAYADSPGWETWDHAVRQLGNDTYLMTYVLRQGNRLSRRATIWQRTSDSWCILYHQGTVVTVEEDDVAPA